MSDPRLELEVPAALDQVGAAGERAEEFLIRHAVPRRAVHAVLVALEELVTNTVKYGFAGAPGQSIRVLLALTADAVELTVADRGRAFDPLAGPEPDLAAPVAERDVGGLGLHLLRRLSREQRYQRRNGENVVWLAFDRQDPALAGTRLRLCPPQSLIALMEEAFPGTNGCTIAFTFRLPGESDPRAVERALDAFVAAQEAMRLRVSGGTQAVAPHRPLFLPRYDLASWHGGRSERSASGAHSDGARGAGGPPSAGWRGWVAAQVSRPLALDGRPLFEVALLSTEEGPRLFVKAHHLISDNGTFRVLCRNLHAALCEGHAPVGPARTYSEFLADDAAYMASARAAEDRAWWLARFADLPEPASLNGVRRPSASPTAAHRTFRVPPSLRARLHAFCAAHRTTHFRVVLTLFGAYLARVSGERDLVLGVPYHNRPPGFHDTAGMFVNPLPVRLDGSEEQSFLDALQAATRELKAGLAHGRYPYGEIVRALSADALYRYSVVQSSPASDPATRALAPEFWPIGASPEHLALCLNPDTPDDEGLATVRCEYRTELFGAADVDRLFARLMHMLEAALSAPERRLGDLPVLTAPERATVLERFNAGRTGAPAVPTYLHLWNAQVAAGPDRVALVHGAHSLTSRELDQRVRRLSATLRARGVERDVVVPILAERGIDFVVAALSVMRAGGGYLPVDPGYPASRVAFILSDCGARLVLAEPSLATLLSGFAGQILGLTDPAPEPGAPVLEWPPGEGTDLAYVIYTSGSTGTPKGVMVEQRNLVSFCTWQRDWFEMGPSDAQAHYYSFAFDAAVGSLFTPLCAGASVHILPEEIRLSIEALNAYFERYRITFADLPTQLAEQFMEWADNRSLRYLLTGGDRLKTFRPRRYALVNEYGPTEVTVSATQCLVERASESIPIGRPLGGVWAYVLDHQLRPAPLGLPGELCLAGHQVARGYLGRPDLTGEKFTANPFATGPENARLYRTGDLVRWLEDGTLEFLGRIDSQVKIRGFRIELGEVEQRLAEVAGVTAAAVVARDDATGQAQLCAYVTTAPGLDLAAVKAALAAALPAYMVPRVIMRLEAMPYSTSGKIDRRALPRPAEDEEAPITAPRTPTEERLARLWREVLGVPRLGVEDDWVALGGDSLKVTLLSARLQRDWGPSLSVSELFRLSTIARLAAHLDRAPREGVRGIPRQPEAALYAPSAAQERLFVLEGLSGIGSAYVLPAELLIVGPLDRERLSFTFDRLVERHEALRTTLEVVDGELRQRVHRSVKYKKLFREIREEDAADALAELSRPFELSAAPLFRLGLFQLAPGRHLLALAMHHAISDGVSTEVLLDEWFALYAGQTLGPAPLQYRDYAAWHRALIDSGEAAAQEEFWTRQLAPPLAVLDLPLDHPRPAAKTYGGRTHTTHVDTALTARLRELAAASSSTLYMLLLAAYGAVLARYAGQEEVLIGTPFSGRSHPEIHRMVGMFVNTLPVRLRPALDKSFRQLLNETRELSLAIAAHQDYPFDRMVERLGIRRDPSRNPIFDVMFGYLSEERASAPDLEVSRFHRERGAAHFDLTLEAVSAGPDRPLTLEWEYSTALFEPATIARLAGHYLRLLARVVEAPDAAIGDVELLAPAERRLLLEEFNQTALEVDRADTASRAFHRAACAHPDRPALVFRERVRTFGELACEVEALAGRLQELGLARDGVAAIMVERSADLVVGALAAMRAGGAYLPIDAAYPQGRVEYMLADSRARLLLTHRSLAARSDGWTGARLFLDDPPVAGPAPAPDASAPADLAYVIYTSGSTGKPKGVEVEHRALMNLCVWVRSFHGVDARDVAATFSGFGFDASVWEIFPFLIAGCTLHVTPDELRLSPPDLAAYFERHGVTVTNLPTQLAEQFLELPRCRSLKTLVTGGDKLKTARARGYNLVNEYGPTEYTVSATAFRVEAPSPNIPIGKPLANTWCYILDRRGHPQPVGVAGELCISGAQMARGYLDRPELTREKFVPNPFASGADNQRLYRTGDLARWRADGNIEFLGRIDSQVKIRGYRIELGEIEQQLLKCSGVTDAVVVDLPDASGQPFLAAYVVASGFDEGTWRDQLAAELPDYMVPSHFTALDALPLNANGKIDRARLPRPERPPAPEYVPPSTPEEEEVAQVWCRVLGLERAGVTDNFFELGGTSIKAISVVARLRQHWTVTINDVFAHQTLGELARALQPMADGLKARLGRLRDELAREPADPEEVAAARAAYHASSERFRTMDLGEAEPWGEVLLTGATGYLGAYLCRALLDAGAWRVVALVRAADDAAARERVLAKAAYYFGESGLAGDARLEVWAADLAQERLGLSAARHAALEGTVDAIVHAAANVRHFGHYAEFHAANVQSVIGLVALARAGRTKVLHHVSTVSVGDGPTPGRAFALFTEDDTAITSHQNHYLRSKAEGERVVDEARQAGLAASIYRVGNIVWDSTSGRHQENLGENAFYQRVKAFVDVGAVPHDARVVEELSHVDTVARAILMLGERPTLRGGNHHLYNPQWVRTSLLLGDPALGLSLHHLSFPRFLDFLAEHVDKPGFRGPVETVLTHMDLIEEAGERTRVEVPADRTVLLLARLGFAWPAPRGAELASLVERALDDRVRLLREQSPFGAAGTEGLRALARVARPRHFAGERFVTWEGEPNDEVHLITHGLAALSRTAPGGWTGTVCVVKPRDVIGLESALGQPVAQVIAEPAMGDLVVLSIPAPAVRNLLFAHPAVSLDLLRELARTNDRLQRLVVSMG